MGQRGAYAKGIAKRAEISVAALEVIGRVGYRKAGIREIAEAVGLSQTGLLHYYDSREELLVDVLRTRDERNRARMIEALGTSASLADFRRWMVAQARTNSRTPGIVQLFAQLSVDAADPRHPAAAFFRERNERYQRALTDAFALAQSEARAPRSFDPAELARLTHAMADGLQILFLADPDLDMGRSIETFFTLLDDAIEPT